VQILHSTITHYLERINQNETYTKRDGYEKRLLYVSNGKTLNLKRPLGARRPKWKGDVEMDLRGEAGCGCLD
jgi:hypothetical protein